MRRLRKFIWWGVLLASPILLFGAVVTLLLELRLAKSYSVAVKPPALSSDPAVLARGKYLVDHVLAWTDCHAPDLGGAIQMDQLLIGRLTSPNLTTGTGGIGAGLTAEDWIRAIRYGIGADGHSLVLMPSSDYAHLSDADLAAVIAYARSVPPVDRTLKATSLALGLRMSMVLMEEPPLSATKAASVTRNAVDPSFRGAYLARIAGCHGCHGETLSGAEKRAPGGRRPTDLTRSGPLSTWSYQDFIRAMRHAQRPDGSRISEAMPVQAFAGMSDEDLKHLWQYLRSV